MYFECNNLTKIYEKNEVVKNVSFGIEKGEVLSIIGQSGSGKTTTLRMINLLSIPDGGNISIDNELIFDGNKKYSEKDFRLMRQNFGMVFQNYNLFPQYTVFENVLIAVRLENRRILANFKNSNKDNKIGYKNLKQELKSREVVKVLDLLKSVDLEKKKDSYPKTLSGGESQRAAIARALAMNPKVLCFDEPTSALDPKLTNEVLNVLKKLKEEGKTMIIVTHEMSFAYKVSDKIAFFSDGEIKEFDIPEKIFNSSEKNIKDFINFVDK